MNDVAHGDEHLVFQLVQLLDDLLVELALGDLGIEHVVEAIHLDCNDDYVLLIAVWLNQPY